MKCCSVTAKIRAETAMTIKTFLVMGLVAGLSVPIQSAANDDGCTLTPGYWKTHSIYGPAVYPDDGWYTNFGPYPAGAAGPDAPAFDSGLTWLEVLRIPPTGGQAWFVLAHQWIAAYLNYYNGAGAGGTDVSMWLSEGAALLDAYDQQYFPKRSADRADALQLAEWLADYNAGYIGPGACADAEPCPCFDGIADDTPYLQFGASSTMPCPEGPDAYDTDYHFQFYSVSYTVIVSTGLECGGAPIYRCSGGPNGYEDFQMSLSQGEYEQCVAGPGWPSMIPD